MDLDIIMSSNRFDSTACISCTIYTNGNKPVLDKSIGNLSLSDLLWLHA